MFEKLNCQNNCLYLCTIEKSNSILNYKTLCKMLTYFQFQMTTFSISHIRCQWFLLGMYISNPYCCKIHQAVCQISCVFWRLNKECVGCRGVNVFDVNNTLPAAVCSIPPGTFNSFTWKICPAILWNVLLIRHPFVADIIHRGVRDIPFLLKLETTEFVWRKA
jgi:hypothetical protein